MLGRRISSVKIASLCRKSSSVCILAGYSSMDAQGARIMKSLNERAGENIKYFGLGGEKMVETGLEDNLADIHKLIDKPLYIHKNAHPFHRERLYAVYMAATRYRNWKVVKEVEKELHSMLFANQPDAVISLGNEYFMKRLYLMIEKKYEEKAGSKTMKPPMIHFDRLMTGQHTDHLKYLDHFFYSVPVPIVNWQYYTFPSTFFGSQGLFDAYEYLYKRSKSHSQLVNKKSIWVNEEYNNVIMEELIQDSRTAWRHKHSVPETNTLIFVSPGSDRQEIKWSGALVSKAVDLFINKFSKVAADNFTVVISLPKDLQEMSSSLESLKWKCKVIFVTERDDRFGAMSASDFGVSLNGDAVTEAAGMQLPVLILDKMDAWHTYWMLLYNQFNNNLSLAAKGEVYPELTGMAFPEKIVELWSEWYLNPKVRYQYIKRLHTVLPKFLPRGPQDSLAVGANKLEYTRFDNPQEVVADKLWSIIQTFKSQTRTPVEDHSKVQKARSSVIAGINGVKICQ